MALLAREYLRALHEVAEAHLAVLSSREYTADPRAGLAARLPMLAAVADAVVDAEAGQALAAQRAAVAAAMAVRPPRPPAAPGGGPQQQPQQQQPWASAPKQPAGSADQVSKIAMAVRPACNCEPAVHCVVLGHHSAITAWCRRCVRARTALLSLRLVVCTWAHQTAGRHCTGHDRLAFWHPGGSQHWWRGQLQPVAGPEWGGTGGRQQLQPRGARRLCPLDEMKP